LRAAGAVVFRRPDCPPSRRHMPADPKYKYLSVSVTPDQKKRIHKAAAHEGLTLSQFVRAITIEYMETNGLWDLRGPDRSKTSTRNLPPKGGIKSEGRDKL
jgi:hypothetical protein